MNKLTTEEIENEIINGMVFELDNIPTVPDENDLRVCVDYSIQIKKLLKKSTNEEINALDIDKIIAAIKKHIFENDEFKDIKNYAKEQKKYVGTLMNEINTGKHDCELIRFKNKDYDIDDIATSKNLNRLQFKEIKKLNILIHDLKALLDIEEEKKYSNS